MNCLHFDCIAALSFFVLPQQASCRSEVQVAAQVGVSHLMDSAAHALGTSSTQEEWETSASPARLGW
jgi:hypothetical protein